MKGGRARLTFLGTGTSQGVPIIGCKCEVCRSADERDKRFRASVFVEYDGLNILVDAGPDFRMQMLRHGISHLDAILLTHNHKDHTGGLDDVRSLNYIDRRAAEIYCERNVLEDLIREYPYVFKFPKYPGAPEWRLHVIDERPFVLRKDSSAGELEWVHDIGYHYRLPDGRLVPTARCLDDRIEIAESPGASSGGSTASLREAPPLASRSEAPVPPLNVPRVAVATPSRLAPGDSGVTVIPIRGLHDKLPVLGFRFGDIAYITDMSSIPDSEFPKLEGLKHLTLNTVSYNKHHSHFSLGETLRLAGRIRPEHTWLTHLSHSFPVHERFCENLARMCAEQGIHSTVRPAYDGLTIE
ncbi:MAG: MBL fold metallo-hydrolase [Bacteroidales bacterium]|nr:MBL fold metallo-hydrolase [Bacteroidales bacterium]